MKEIYWLQRLGDLNTLMWVVFIIAIIVCMVVLGWRAVIWNDVYFDSEENFVKIWRKILSKALIVSIVSVLGAIFIPTTKEMYVIYGVGGTIDYLKENETAKQLPDKVINALDKWVDEFNNEDKQQ